MPQLDISTWPPQLFWLAISFFTLYFFVSRIVVPGTGGVIAARKDKIDGDLAAAAAMKGDTEAALKAYEDSLAQARSKSATTSMEARQILSLEADKASRKLNADLADKASVADKKISAAKAKALAGLNSMASEISSDIVNALTGAKVTKAAATAAVAKAMK